MDRVWQFISEKSIQWLISIAGGLMLAIESSVVFFIPCLFAVLIDVWTAWKLGKRLHKKHPDKADGKFKSEYKFRIMITMIVALVGIIVANYVDLYVIKDTDITVRFIVGVFLFYQCWSILENWSSENENKIAKALQRIMVNKAERHINVPLEDIFFNDNKNEITGNEDGKTNT